MRARARFMDVGHGLIHDGDKGDVYDVHYLIRSITSITSMLVHRPFILRSSSFRKEYKKKWVITMKKACVEEIY